MPNPPNSKYAPNVQDIRRAIEGYKYDSISFTQLAVVLTPIANAHNCRWVDWHMMKRVVEGMVIVGDLEKIQQRQGFYRYGLRLDYAEDDD